MTSHMTTNIPHTSHVTCMFTHVWCIRTVSCSFHHHSSPCSWDFQMVRWFCSQGTPRFLFPNCWLPAEAVCGSCPLWSPAAMHGVGLASTQSSGSSSACQLHGHNQSSTVYAERRLSMQKCKSQM